MDKWKTILALILMGFAIVFNWGWFWAILIIAGLIYTIVSKEIHFVEEIQKSKNPKLFWTIVAIWTGLTLLSVFNYLGWV